MRFAEWRSFILNLNKRNTGLLSVPARTMRSFIIVGFLFAAGVVSAQHKTTVLLPAGFPGSAQLSKQAESLLNEANAAFQSGRKLKTGKLNLSPTARKTLTDLWSYRPFFCSETDLNLQPILRPDSLIELRGIPIQIKVEAGELTEEHLVLAFRRNGQLESVALGLPEHQYESVLSGGLTVADLRRRQIILDFVENFRTAYNRKDLTYLGQVFSDQALIIVGHVVQEGEDRSDYLENNLGTQRVELIRQSKAEYLTGLERVFGKNDYIKVGFEEIEVVQHRKFQSIYGVSLLQYWYSPTYSDKGYLFLMIDFRDENQPIIHVRAWQPGKHTAPDSVISLGDFEIIN